MPMGRMRRNPKVQKVQIVKKKKKRNVTLQRPIANKLVTTVRYAHPIKIRPAIAGAATDYIFSLNGLWDPDITLGIGSHQPRGFDQLMSLYEHYVVLGAKVRFEWGTDETTDVMTVALSQRANSTDILAISDVIEYTNVKTMTRGRFNSGGPNNMTYKCNPSKFLGRSKPLADPDLKGDTSNNPSEGSYLHVNAFYTDPSTTPKGYVIGIVTIDYITAFIEPRGVSQS